MRRSIDLNADLGEGFGESRLEADGALLDLVSSANVACGFHAGDVMTMRDTVRAARERHVTIGAHPSYPDIPGFGRRELGLPAKEIARHVEYQIRTLADICSLHGARLSYVKPHGALYNRAVWDEKVADVIAETIARTNPSLSLLGLPDSEMSRAAERARLQFVNEAFVDRAYRKDGTLVPRSEPNAVIHDVQSAVQRAVMLVRMHHITAQDGSEVRIHAQSLCVHGDNPDSTSMLRSLRGRLEAAGVTIAPFAA
ncbi:MAG TPA: 5-oxoprolinase subunit PxpA [Gemmatimonadaceae bacterium]